MTDKDVCKLFVQQFAMKPVQIKTECIFFKKQKNKQTYIYIFDSQKTYFSSNQ